TLHIIVCSSTRGGSSSSNSSKRHVLKQNRFTRAKSNAAALESMPRGAHHAIDSRRHAESGAGISEGNLMHARLPNEANPFIRFRAAGVAVSPSAAAAAVESPHEKTVSRSWRAR